MKSVKPVNNHASKFIILLIIVLFILLISSFLSIQPNLDIVNNVLPTQAKMVSEQGLVAPDVSLSEVTSATKQTQKHYNINKDIRNIGRIPHTFNNTEISPTEVESLEQIPPTQLPTAIPLSVQIDIDKYFVSIAKGDVAINSGQLSGFDPSVMQIQSTTGALQLMPDGSWLWTYPTNNVSPENQAVVVKILKDDQMIARRAFSLIFLDSPQFIEGTNDTLTVDQSSVVVEHGNLAVNTGSFGGIVSGVISSEVSFGEIEILPDGSWIWIYSTEDETVESPKVVSVNVETNNGIILQSTFELNITVEQPEETVLLIDPPLAPTQSPVSVAVLPTVVIPPPSTLVPTLMPTSVPSGNGGGSAVVLSTQIITYPSTSIPTSVPTQVPTIEIEIVTQQPTQVPTAVPTIESEGSASAAILPTQIPPTMTEVVDPTQIPPTMTEVVDPTQVPPTMTEVVDPTQVPPTMTEVVDPTQIPPTMTEVVDPTQVPPTMTEVVDPTQVPPTMAEVVDPTQVPPTMTEVVDPTQVPPTMTQTLVPTQIPPTMTQTLVPTQPPTTTPIAPVTDAYYVSRLGNNGDGRSWATAWNELDQINWSVIQPGDTIYLDGGSSQMQYNTHLEFGKSGQPNNPIRILASGEANRNGQVIFFGGRSNPLPYCNQQSYNNTSQLIENGIVTDDHSYIMIDGMDWNGISIHGYGRSGIQIDRNSKNITFRHIEVYNNGRAEYSSRNNWRPGSAGIRLAGANMTFQRVIIHDNGQDAFQSLFGNNNLANFRLEQSWLYNGRKHPTVDESSNYCTHTDGIQIYSGGVVSGMTIIESVLGPGFTHNLILGQTTTSNGDSAVVNDLFLQDVVLSKAADNNLHGYSGTSMHNWALNRVTIHCPKTKGHCARAYNSDHTITNSVFYGSRLTFPDGVDNRSNNCIWQTTGYNLGLETNPNFLDVSDSDHFSLDDYAVQNPNCVGSQLTSVEQLLSGAPINQSIATARVVQSSDTQVIVKPTIESTDTPLIITVDNVQINSLEGDLVVNTGQITPSTTVIESVTASLGTVELINGVGWRWNYLPDDGPSHDQLVTVDIQSADGKTTQTSFVINVDNVSPTATLSATLIDTGALTMELTFVDAIDPSESDIQAGFTFQYDCDGDGIFEIANELSTVCNLISLEQINSVGRILDKDNGFTDYYVDIDKILAGAVMLNSVSTDVPTLVPTNTPTIIPTDVPTLVPTNTPTIIPTDVPTLVPTNTPTIIPTDVPTNTPET